MTDRIVVENYLYGGFGDLKIDEKSLKYMYKDYSPTIIETAAEELMVINGTLLIDVVDRDKSKHSMEEKILDIDHHREAVAQGYAHPPLSWNEFRAWVLANPHVMDEWHDLEYGAENRFQSSEDDDDICWQGGPLE